MASRWISLLVMTRVVAAASAVLLLVVHRVSDHDPELVVATVAWTVVSLAALTRSPRLQRAPLAWAADAGGALFLVWLSEDWRSPFYVFALTTLVLPATTLQFRQALAWGGAFTLGYLGVAVATRLDSSTLESTIRLETLVTHLMVPLIVTLALAYARGLVARLEEQRERSERLAVQAERQRIAWELHDSAKQRVHAAHLLLSTLPEHEGDGVVGHALAELRAATADMQTSVAELREPLDGRPVDEMLRERARSLVPVSSAEIEVTGALPRLAPLVAAHAFRIGAEALTNAVRHAGARHVQVILRDDGDRARIIVRDDGRGMPAVVPPGSTGLRSMRARAETIGADLDLRPCDEGPGTEVVLAVPVAGREAAA